MTYLPNENVKAKFSDSGNLDAFARLRVASPQTLFESQLQYDDKPQLWETNIEGNGSNTYLPNESSCLLSVSDTGDGVVRQTYEYFRYQPGKSTFISFTAVFDEPDTNIVRRAGYFDDNDGIFLQMDSEMKVGIRSSITGTPDDDIIPRSNWNLDKLDGNGPSKLTIDFTNANIYVMDLQWLGSGRVRFGVMYRGDIIYFHEKEHSSTIPSVYMKTATLPCRYEIYSNGGSGQFKQLCTTVISEGGFKQKGYVHAIDTGNESMRIGNTEQSVLSIRLNPNYPRATLFPQFASILQTSNSDILRYRIVIRHETDDTMTWNDISGDSLVQYSTTMSGITGGQVIESGYLRSGEQCFIDSLFENVTPLASTRSGEPFILSIVCESLQKNIPVYASIRFREIH